MSISSREDVFKYGIFLLQINTFGSICGLAETNYLSLVCIQEVVINTLVDDG